MEPMKPFPIPDRHWQLVSQDLCTLNCISYLVTVCHFSDWLELDMFENTRSCTVIHRTKAHFARYGIPAVCHTDNGPQFVSDEYASFAKELGFRHTTSSPYHSQGNGKAEAAMKIVKSMLRNQLILIIKALLRHINTPPKDMHSHQLSACHVDICAQLSPQMINCFSRKLSLLVTLYVRKNAGLAIKLTMTNMLRATHTKLEVGDQVYAKPPPQSHGRP